MEHGPRHQHLGAGRFQITRRDGSSTADTATRRGDCKKEEAGGARRASRAGRAGPAAGEPAAMLAGGAAAMEGRKLWVMGKRPHRDEIERDADPETEEGGQIRGGEEGSPRWRKCAKTEWRCTSK